jgi:hypothetical protein
MARPISVEKMTKPTANTSVVTWAERQNFGRAKDDLVVLEADEGPEAGAAGGRVVAGCRATVSSVGKREQHDEDDQPPCAVSLMPE